MVERIASEHKIIEKKQNRWLIITHLVQMTWRWFLQYNIPSLITASNIAYTALMYCTSDRCELTVIATYTPMAIWGKSSNHMVATENTSEVKLLSGIEISMHFRYISMTKVIDPMTQKTRMIKYTSEWKGSRLCLVEMLAKKPQSKARSRPSRITKPNTGRKDISFEKSYLSLIQDQHREMVYKSFFYTVSIWANQSNPHILYNVR